MWAWVGLGFSLLAAAYALNRARSPTVSFYESEVYGMTRGSHLRFAYVSLAFAAAFAAASLLPALPSVAFLAVYAVLSILYGASFVRGATGEDE